MKVNRRNWFWQQLQSASRTKLSCVAYAGVDLTEPKAAVRGTSYLSNLLDTSEAKINLDERSFCTNQSFVCGHHKLRAACCLVALEHATHKNPHNQISQTYTTKVFPVYSERVLRACPQGIIKITNHGQIKQIQMNILMQPVLCLLTKQTRATC